MAYGTEKGGSTTGPADVAVDTVAGKDYQIVKLVDGTEGSAIAAIVDDTGGLFVQPIGFSGNASDVHGGTAELFVGGGIANGNPDQGNPVKVGGVYNSAPIPVSDGDRADLLTDSVGRLQVSGVTASPGLTDTQLRATPVPVSGTVTASGPLTDTQLRATPVPVSGTVTATVASTTITSISAGNNNIGDVDVASIAAGNNNIGDVDIASVPAPLSTSGGGTEATALRVTVANNSTGLLPVSLAALPAVNRPATATLTNVAGSVTSVTLLASTAGRLGATIWNDSTSILYVKFGTTASATSVTVKMIADAYYEFPAPVYTGRVDGIWVSATGNARITEMTA